jgi:hypothetical protein
MTIAYCWLDRSLSMERITAVADSRISQQLSDRSWVQMQNETIKLFRVPVRCYSMENFDCTTGTWRTPYFETELGLAFAGDCTGALSIANSFMRAVSQLVVDGSARPNPEPAKLYQMRQGRRDALVVILRKTHACRSALPAVRLFRC